MSDNSLTQKKCTPCEGGVEPFAKEQAEVIIKQTPGWQLSAGAKLISREYIMKNFMAAIRFINAVADVSEAENHHPDIHLTGYRRVNIEISTHKIGGLSENDFILAAKINELPVELKEG